MIDTKQLIDSLDELRSSERELYGKLQRERQASDSLRAELAALKDQRDRIIALANEMRNAQRKIEANMMTAAQLFRCRRAEQTFDAFLESYKAQFPA